MSRIMLCVETNTSGGAERVLVSLANYFANEGHDTIFVNGDTESSFYPIDQNVHVIKMGLDRDYRGKTRKFLLHYSRIKELFIKYKPDAVIVFLFNMEAPVILAGLATKTRVFASVRNSAHSYPIFVRLFRKMFYPHIAGVVFQSNIVMNCEDFKKIKNKKVIMNPLSTDFSFDYPIIKRFERKKWIVSAGRLSEQKNHLLLINAFKKMSDEFPDYELHIFGKGPLENHLRHYISSIDMEERIILEGEVANAIISNRDAYCFVLSSNFEGFPNALAEAMAIGIPSISTDFDSGVASQLIQDGINGFLFDVQDEAGLETKLRLLIQMNDNEYNNIVSNSISIREQLLSETIGKQWEEFLLNYGG